MKFRFLSMLLHSSGESEKQTRVEREQYDEGKKAERKITRGEMKRSGEDSKTFDNTEKATLECCLFAQQ